MTFGEKLQKLRKEAGMSQEELATRLDVSRQAVSKWEREDAMQKLFFVLPAALALLLCGCQPPANTAVDARELKKAQQIEVIPAGATDATEIITGQGEIEDFVETLDVPGWVLESLPDGAEPIGVFQLSQSGDALRKRSQQKTPPRARRFLFTAAKIPAHRRCVSAPPAGTAPGKSGTAPGTPY